MNFLKIRLWLVACIWAAGAAAQPVATAFVDSLDPDARAAIGIDAMTPAQLAALEAAVQRYVGREVKTSTEVAVAAAVENARVAQAADENKRSLLERTRVLLAPGTDIEYSRIETTVTEPFAGWEKGTRFRMANGQIWRVIEGSYATPPEPAGKAVAIEPGAFGSFFLKFEGVRSRPKVELAGR